MSDQIVNGSAPTNQNPQHVEGFLTKLTATDLSSAEAAAADYGRLHSLGVDGIHASMETEVSSVVGDETYRHAAGVYISGSGESGSEATDAALRRLHGVDVHSRHRQHEAECDSPCWRTQRRADARGFGRRNVADAGDHP